MKNLNQLVDSLSQASGTAEPIVRHIGRRLREDGVVPGCMSGGSVSTGDVALLVLATLVTDLYPHATKTTTAYGALQCA